MLCERPTEPAAARFGDYGVPFGPDWRALQPRTPGLASVLARRGHTAEPRPRLGGRRMTVGASPSSGAAGEAATGLTGPQTTAAAGGYHRSRWGLRRVSSSLSSRRCAPVVGFAAAAARLGGASSGRDPGLVRATSRCPNRSRTRCAPWPATASWSWLVRRAARCPDPASRCSAEGIAGSGQEHPSQALIDLFALHSMITPLREATVASVATYACGPCAACSGCLLAPPPGPTRADHRPELDQCSSSRRALSASSSSARWPRSRTSTPCTSRASLTVLPTRPSRSAPSHHAVMAGCSLCVRPVTAAGDRRDRAQRAPSPDRCSSRATTDYACGWRCWTLAVMTRSRSKGWISSPDVGLAGHYRRAARRALSRSRCRDGRSRSSRTCSPRATTRRPPFYAAELAPRLRRGTSFLDLGCGVEVNSVLAASKGCWSTALDVNPSQSRTPIDNLRQHGLADRARGTRLSESSPAIRPYERFDVVYWNIPLFTDVDARTAS